MAGPTPAKRATARKTPARKAAPAGPKVTLNLDTLDKAKAFPDLKLPRVPFTFLQQGVEYELGDPRDSDWKMSLQLSGNPFLLMRHSLKDADEPVDDPTEDELMACRERHGLPMQPPEPGSEQAKQEAEDWPDGVTVALIDRFTASYLPGWKLDALFKNWYAHYQIDLTKGILRALLGKSE